MFIVKFLLREKKREVHSPNDFDYMHKLRYWLGFVDSWPESQSSSKFRRSKNYFVVAWFLLFLAQVMYIRDNVAKLSFFDLGHCYITAILIFVTLQRTTLNFTQSYREMTKEFIEQTHLYHHRNMSHYAMQIFQKVHKACTFLTNLNQSQVIVGLFLFNLSPLWRNIENDMFMFNSPPINGTYSHCIYYWLPFDYTTNFIGYTIVFIANFIISYDCAVLICFTDLYISLICFHMWGLLKILRHHLENFPQPQMVEHSLASARFNEQRVEVNTLLIRLIEHHKLIKRSWNRISDAFSTTLCVCMLIHQVLECILLLECARLDKAAIAEYGLLTAVTFQQLIQISLSFEIVGSESDRLGDAVYSLPWHSMDVRSMKMVLFFLRNVQEPINVKAMGLVPVGVQTMAAILKTSVSYFIMLRAMSK